MADSSEAATAGATTCRHNGILWPTPCEQCRQDALTKLREQHRGLPRYGPAGVTYYMKPCSLCMALDRASGHEDDLACHGHANLPRPVPTAPMYIGWECPRCKTIHGPWVLACVQCLGTAAEAPPPVRPTKLTR